MYDERIWETDSATTPAWQMIEGCLHAAVLLDHKDMVPIKKLHRTVIGQKEVVLYSVTGKYKLWSDDHLATFPSMDGTREDIESIVARSKHERCRCGVITQTYTYLFVPAVFMARLKVMLIRPSACARFGTA
jgi:hypothetical protein